LQSYASVGSVVPVASVVAVVSGAPVGAVAS
jgi:hypothetical protein